MLNYPVKKRLAALRRDERGAVAMIFALSVMIMMGVVGLAVDVSRTFSVSTRVQGVLDASALAAAKLLDLANATDGDVKAKGAAYFNGHAGEQHFPGVKFTNLVVTPDRQKGTVLVTVDIAVPTSFSNMAGMKEFTFQRFSQVVYKMRRVELALVLDVTGSMSAGGKIGSMKTAAKDVVRIMLESSSTGGSVINRVALAPFAASVNVGPYLAAVADGTSIMNDTCVLERPGTASIGDSAPSAGTKSRVMMTATGVPPDYRYSCPTAQIVPLTQDYTLLNTKIDAMTPNGGTSGHMGASWGWNLISPNWSSVFTGGSAPASYSDPETIKAVLIMTDGSFNTAYKSGDATPVATQIDESYKEFDDTCKAMKAKNISVYTVGFALSLEAEPGRTRAKKALSDCATGVENFFDAETNSQLITAFREIAERLNSLKVTS